MKQKSNPTFEPVLRIDGRSNLNPKEVSLKRLRDAVAGRDKTFPRAQAMALLQVSDFPGKHRDFELLLQDEAESPTIRQLAAMKLWRINTPESVNILLNNTHINDNRVLAAIVTSLGRIGGKSALKVLTEIAKKRTDSINYQAKFAASLISYRLDLKGNELPIPKNEDYLEVPDMSSRQIHIDNASYEEAEFCLRSVSRQPFGVEFSVNAAYKVRCEKLFFVVLFNRDIMKKDSLQGLMLHKMLLGVIARQSDETRLYSVVNLILSSPATKGDAANLLIYSPSGFLSHGGKIIREGKNARFWIRSVIRPGSRPVRIDGTIVDGQLKIVSALCRRFLHQKQILTTSDRTAVSFNLDKK